MADWSLQTLLESLHEEIEQQLKTSRKAIAHSGSKGDASEEVWLGLFKGYLPKRYQAEKGFVVDSKGNFSDQMDIIIFDRQYSPFIFQHKGQFIIPAESVYAVFEAKQAINATYIEYAQEKVATVRSLHRTSLPIPHAGGVYPAKPPMPIIGGILTFESDWSSPMGDTLEKLLATGISDKKLDMGCVAAHGFFYWDEKDSKYDFSLGGKPATAFLFKLISQLQYSGTVPMIDVLAYSQWLAPPVATV